MKKLFFINLIFILIIGCSESKYQTLSEEDINNAQKSFAESLAVDILTSMKSGEFKSLRDEATLAMQKGLSPEKQEASYDQIKGMFGDFESLSYYEACIPTEGAIQTVYRFKGKFESAFPEIRVVINEENKLSGFWIKPWNDELQ